MISRIFRIGTRDSKLAVFQAEKVQQLLENSGIPTELVYIKSEGDLNTTAPLQGFSQVGVFTRALDEATMDGRIDIAVHSNKDLPTALYPGIVQAAVLERDDPRDVLVIKGDRHFLKDKNSTAVIATGSVRRTAMWKVRYPNHQLVPLRGNVQTRLQKLEDHAWNGAIFSYSGLDRLGITPENIFFPEWMVPAPAQGVISVVCREDDALVREILQPLNHEETGMLTSLEREFLRLMEGGCIAPIGALATIQGKKVQMKTQVLNADGSQSVTVEKSALKGSPEAIKLAVDCYNEACAQGAKTLVESVRNA